MYVVIRVRGRHDIRKEVKETLEMLRLTRVNHAVLAKENPVQKNMVKKVSAYVTFGEVDEKTLAKMLEKRGRQKGNIKLDKEYFKTHKIKGVEELANLLVSGKKTLQELGIKPVLRLHPPKKGYERIGIKKSYSVGGALGYRGSDINQLALKMV